MHGCLIGGALEYARISYDLFPADTMLAVKVNTHPGTLGKRQYWQASPQTWQKTLEQVQMEMQESSHAAVGGLKQLLKDAVHILSENAGTLDNKRTEQRLRLVLFVATSSPPSDLGSWSHHDIDGSSFSIPNYLNSLISEHNANCATNANLGTRIERVELSLLVAVPEEPSSATRSDTSSRGDLSSQMDISHSELGRGESKPSSDATPALQTVKLSFSSELKQNKDDSIKTETSVNASDGRTRSTSPPKGSSSSATSTVASPRGQTSNDSDDSKYQYFHDPRYTCDGQQLPPTATSTETHVSFDLSFVRPSFMHQAVTELAFSHLNLQQLTLESVPFREPRVGVMQAVSTTIQVLMPFSNLEGSLQPALALRSKRSINSTPIHIGRVLGAGQVLAMRTKTLRWKPWDSTLSLHSLPCSSISRISPVFVSHRPTKSILATVLDGRPCLFYESPPTAIASSSAPSNASSPHPSPTHLLVCHGNYVWVHVLRRQDNMSMLKSADDHLTNETLLRSLRSNSMKALIEENSITVTTWSGDAHERASERKYTPFQAMTEQIVEGSSGAPLDIAKGPAPFSLPPKPQSTSDRTSPANGTAPSSTYKTTRQLEKYTRVFPLLEDDSILYSGRHHDSLRSAGILLIRSLMTRPTLQPADIAPCQEHLKKLQQLAKDNDYRIFPSARSTVAKRRELYVQLWTELLALASQYEMQSPTHMALAEEIRLTAPDPALVLLSQQIAAAAGDFGVNMEGIRPNADPHILQPLPVPRHAEKSPAPLQLSSSSSHPPQTGPASTQQSEESKWLYDLSTVRHDIVGLKDISWSGATMWNPQLPSATSEHPPSSLFSAYWNQASQLVHSKNGVRKFP